MQDWQKVICPSRIIRKRDHPAADQYRAERLFIHPAALVRMALAYIAVNMNLRRHNAS
jgi:hypothetical protein